MSEQYKTIRFLKLTILCALLVSCVPTSEDLPLFTASSLLDLSANYQITSVAFSPDGLTLAAGVMGGDVVLWQASNGTRGQTIKAYQCCRVYGIAFSPDGYLLATAVPFGEVFVWQVNNGSLVRTLKYSAILGRGVMHMTSIAYSPDGKKIAAGAYDGSLFVWEESNGMLLYNTFGSEFSSSIFSLAFSPDGQLLAVAEEKTVLILRVEDWSLVSTIRGSKGQVLSTAFAPDSGTLAIGDLHGDTRLVDINNGSTLQRFPTRIGNRVWSIAFSSDGESLAIGTDDGKVRVRQVSNGALLYVIDVSEGEVKIAFDPDGEKLAIGSSNGEVQLWSVP